MTLSGQAPLQSEYDIIIVGSGGGSMCAALAAQDAGLTSVILEKQAIVGGSTSLSGGILWVPNHPLLAAAGVEDSEANGAKYLDHVVGPDAASTNAVRRAAFLRYGPEMISFLLKKGMKLRRPVDTYPDYYDDLPGGLPQGRSLVPTPYDVKKLGDWYPHLAVYRPIIPVPLGAEEFPAVMALKRSFAGKLKALKLGWMMMRAKLFGEQVSGTGAALQGRMLELAVAANLAPHTETPVQDLIVEGNRVVGVRAVKDGKPIEIRARRGVLIDSGGFSRNTALRAQFGRATDKLVWTSANHGDTGDMLQSMIALGADTSDLDTAWWVVTSHHVDGTWPAETTMPDGEVYPFQHHLDISLPHVILVDQDGRRFTNESGSYMDVGENMYKRHQATERGIPAWAIFDARHRERYQWGPILPGNTPDAWIESGYMKKADTLEELAALCGIDAAGLTDEARKFNSYVDAGVDGDFNRGGRAFDRAHGDHTYKKNPCLGKIEQGPFYAVAIYPHDVGTAGGVVADEHARVLRKDGTVIDGLYAFGNVSAPVFGRFYPGAGASIAASFTFGYVAAQHCAQKPA